MLSEERHREVVRGGSVGMTTNLKDFITTPPNEEWESLVFWLTMGMGIFGQACTMHSPYYCLDGYRTMNPYQNSSRKFQPPYDIMSVQAWFRIIVEKRWKRINLINFDKPDDCCEAQVRRYLVWGYHNKGMNPDEYMNKLTDYQDEDKPLNFIAAVGLANECENVILEVGFGPGNLRRSHHMSINEGAPYVLAGRQHDDFGNPLYDSRAFEYENPGQHLTFHWFKHNIMCKDHPWICQPKTTKNSSTGDNKDDGEASTSKKSSKGGSKKNRRKQQANTNKNKQPVNQSSRRRHLLDLRSIDSQFRLNFLNKSWINFNV
ncbi:uncharacterized protein LOC142350342 isoform X2 [Convolutriloba macropyga]|uniref:uncharacterized protein LOC142350342 isoform X2 n=1 Tax=Convolutriloba macropyga TaxID=536237 RepID=UPI003F525BD9